MKWYQILVNGFAAGAAGALAVLFAGGTWPEAVAAGAAAMCANMTGLFQDKPLRKE